jgi:hypothetical protein
VMFLKYVEGKNKLVFIQTTVEGRKEQQIDGQVSNFKTHRRTLCGDIPVV